MDVTHGDTVTKEEVRMWRDKAFALQKQVAQLTARIAQLDDVYQMAFLMSYEDTPELRDGMRKALAAVDKGES